MKNNTEELKEMLKKSLRKAPNDFALFEVRRYINLAISKIEDIEKRREKRSEKSEERSEERKRPKENQ